MKTITPRHLKAIELYTNPDYNDTFGNMTKSYLGAGYRENKGTTHAACRLFSDPQISEIVSARNKEYKDKRAEKCDFDEAFIRSQWLQLLEDCKETVDVNGEKVTKIVDRTNANSVLRAMAQHRAMLTDKLQTEDVTEGPRPEDAIEESECKINEVKVAWLSEETG